MKKNLTIRLLMLLVISILMYSCMHEDMSTISDPDPSKEYTNKSLWKEDEKYIGNVKKVFDQYADKNYFYTKYGNVLWDYALTMGTFDESYLKVPIAKDGKIKFVLTAERKADKVYFKIKNEKNSIEFFDILVFKDRKQLKGEIIEREANGNSSKSSFCYTVKVTWSFLSETTGEVLQTGEYYETRCKSTGPGGVVEPVNPTDCLEDGCTGGGSGGGGGYPYPETPTTPDLCQTMKQENQKQAFKDKVAEIDKKEMFNKPEETGYAAAYGTHPFEKLANTANDNLKFLPGNKYYGFIHNHLDSKEGVVKIFSPADVATFLTHCVRNAHTSGTMADAYGMVITSQGNYILKYSGDGNYSMGPNQESNWLEWYVDKYERLSESELANPKLVEKIFTQFLVEKVKIDGLELYKSDKITGDTEKLEYNTTNNTVQSTSCP